MQLLSVLLLLVVYLNSRVPGNAVTIYDMKVMGFVEGVRMEYAVLKVLIFRLISII